jgi:hypothetical protein
MRNPVSFRRKTAAILLAAAFLAACQANVPVRAKAPVKGAAKVAAPIAAPSPAAKVPDGLAFSGSVQVDAHYVIAAGGGNVIASGGGNVIAAGGGNVISAGGGNYRTLGVGQRPVAGAVELAVGTMLPVQGMAVEALNMLTGKPYGKPVLSDAKGGFTLDVPAGTTDNVLLVARFPGSDDARLIYPLVVSPTQADNRLIDEDTATVTRYMRRCMVAYFARQLQGTSGEADVEAFVKSFNLPAMLAALTIPAFNEFQAAAKARGTASLSTEARRAIAQRFTDALLAKVKLAEVTIDPAVFKAQVQAEPALTAMADIMRQLREAAAVKMAADPDYFPKQEFVKSAVNKSEIKRPADLNEFMVTEYLMNDDLNANVYAALNGVAKNLDVPLDQVDRLQRTGDTIALSLAKVFIFDKATRQVALAAITDAPTD